LWLVLHLELIFITFTVGITFSLVITFSGDTIACVEVSTMFKRPSVDALVLNGAAIVVMFPSGKCKTWSTQKLSSFHTLSTITHRT